MDLATVIGLVVAPARDVFYRRATLFDERLSSRWIAAIAIVVAGSIWIGLFAFRHVEYSHELWWQFALDARAPRFVVSCFRRYLEFKAGVFQRYHPQIARYLATHYTVRKVVGRFSILERKGAL